MVLVANTTDSFIEKLILNLLFTVFQHFCLRVSFILSVSQNALTRERNVRISICLHTYVIFKSANKEFILFVLLIVFQHLFAFIYFFNVQVVPPEDGSLDGQSQHSGDGVFVPQPANSNISRSSTM